MDQSQPILVKEHDSIINEAILTNDQVEIHGAVGKAAGLQQVKVKEHFVHFVGNG